MVLLDKANQSKAPHDKDKSIKASKTQSQYNEICTVQLICCLHIGLFAYTATFEWRKMNFDGKLVTAWG